MKKYNINETIVVNNQCGIHNGPVMSLSLSVWSENSISTSFDEIWTRYGDEIIEGNYNYK